MTGIFAPHRVVAAPGFNRWVVILPALALNLSVGQVYAFSVFNLPLTRALGIRQSAPDDWSLAALGWTFTLAYVFLGMSAAFAGRWQDRVGPRVGGFVAACCFGGGFIVSAFGVWFHRIAVIFLGYGVLGGCGLGLGFNTAIPVLMQWFPDHRGLAMGFAVMGFGGGAFIAAPFSYWLMRQFTTASSVGVAETWIVLGVVYFSVMTVSAFAFRVPPAGWRPAHHVTSLENDPELAPTTTQEAVRTPQFYLLWTLFALHVTAGLGVLSQASAMVQEIFDGFSAAAAAWFVALLSIFNMCGRLVWASLSDVLGRKATFGILLGLGPVLYAAVPLAGYLHSLTLFAGCFAVILSMYGGGFACMPPYIADLFGARHVGAINGRILTALSVGGVLGPALVSYLRQYLLNSGSSKSHAYDLTMYVMAGLLSLAFLCNLAVRPVRAPRRPATREGDFSAAGR